MGDDGSIDDRRIVPAPEPPKRKLTARRALWLTVPNALTLARPLLALGAFRAMRRGDLRQAEMLLVAGAATDSLDGVLARHLDATTAIGARLDTVADRAMIAASLAALLQTRGCPPGLVAISGIREVLLSAGAAAAAPMGVPPPGANKAGKAATALLLGGASAVIAGVVHEREYLRRMGVASIALSVAPAYSSLFRYARHVRAHLKGGR